MKTEEFLTVVFQTSTVTSDSRSVGVTNEQNSILTSQKVPSIAINVSLTCHAKKTFWYGLIGTRLKREKNEQRNCCAF